MKKAMKQTTKHPAARRLAACLPVVPLALCLVLSGCGGRTQTASGTWNGQTVTLKVRARTERAVDNTVSGLFSHGYAAVCLTEDDGERFAFVDADGSLLGDTTYAFAYSFDEEGRARVEKDDGTWAYIDTQGKEAAQAEAPASESPEVYEENGRFGLKSQGGETLTQAMFSFVSGTSAERNFAVLAEGDHKNVMISPQGEVLTTLPDDCVDARDLGEGIACAWEGDGGRIYRLLNTDGEALSQRDFSAVGTFEDGLAPVTAGGKLGLVDSGGTVVVEPTLPIDDEGEIRLGLQENTIVGSLDGKLVLWEVARS